MLVYQRVSQEHENEKWLDKPRFFSFSDTMRSVRSHMKMTGNQATQDGAPQ